MGNTKVFRTKTMFLDRRNGYMADYWICAIDLGYSGVKLISDNKVATFPSYAEKRSSLNIFGAVPDSCIRYTDLETKEQWIVGQLAQNGISDEDTSISEEALYGRDRYLDPMFKVIARTALGIGTTKNRYGDPDGKRIMLQTGLPPKYLKMDRALLMDVFVGRHHFSVQIGDEKPCEYDITLREEDIEIMEQPRGALFSVAVDNDGRFTEDGKSVFSENVIILDPGFGTLDTFPVKCSVIQKMQTFPQFGMHEILRRTTERICDKFDTEISVPAMQKYLETGSIMQHSRTASRLVEFGDILYEESKKVCDEALNQLAAIYPLHEYNYLVISGGTGCAWDSYIRTKFKGMEQLKIVSASKNDTTLPAIFGNVRGYYLYRLMSTKQKTQSLSA